MTAQRKKPKADLRKYYPVFLETGLLITLLVFLVGMKMEVRPAERELDLSEEQEIVEIEEVIRTKQMEKPPPPPRPPVPVAVPNDEVVEDPVLNLDAELRLQNKLELPPPPDDREEEEENFFVVVEQMPRLKGGLARLQECVEYPEVARRAGIEGRVIVQFVVNEQGRVENPKVIRGIGGGADEEALRCVKKAEFVPGMQRGNPVPVQYSLPVVFRLQN
ncbi:MAG: energy transducer TonB [Balneolaceae bacterium]|nr:energy transducer TonB [Balneolaceae bacterium]